MKDVLNRNCGGCGKLLTYKSLNHLKRAEKNSSQCNSCSKSGKNNPFFNKRGNLHPLYGRIRLDMKGDKNFAKRKSVRDKISKKQSGKNNSMYGKVGKLNPRFGTKHSVESITKIGNSSKKSMSNPKIREKIRKSIVEKQLGISYETYLLNITPWEKYKKDVWRITNTQKISGLENHNKRGRTDIDINAYHLDHIVSLKVGFNKNIPPHIIGDIKNLRFIPAKDNCKKSYISNESDIRKLLEDVK